MHGIPFSHYSEGPVPPTDYPLMAEEYNTSAQEQAYDVTDTSDAPTHLIGTETDYAARGNEWRDTAGDAVTPATETPKPEHEPIEAVRYYKTGPEGEIIPLDPLTGEPLEPHTIPESLARDPELRRGFEYLGQHAGRLYIDILLSPHGAADDLQAAGIDLRTEATELAQNGGTLFLEQVLTEKTEAMNENVFNALAALPPSEAESFRALIGEHGKDDFVAEVLRQIAGTGVQIHLPDYNSDSADTPDATLARWAKEVASIQNRIVEGRETTTGIDKWIATTLGLTIYRNFYFIGKMGRYLAEHAPEQGDIFAKLLVGRNHRAIGDDLDIIGANVTQKGDMGRSNALVARFRDCVSQGQISFDDRLAFMLQ